MVTVRGSDSGRVGTACEGASLEAEDEPPAVLDVLLLGAVEDAEELELVELHPASSPARITALSPAEEMRFQVEWLIKGTSSIFFDGLFTKPFQFG